MEPQRLSQAWRAPLILLLVTVVMLCPAHDLLPSAPASATPEPRSSGMGPELMVDYEDASRGLTLIAPYNDYNVILVDDDGKTVHTWRTNRQTIGRVEMLDDGTIFRGRSGYRGSPTGIQLIDWDGTVLWDYIPPDPYQYHHDVEMMPNGNFLINTMVLYTVDQMVALGRDPDLVKYELSAEPVIEVQPNGTSGGEVVWVWDPLDHYVQDYDDSKPNYGVVKDHPELVDLNYPSEHSNEWQHSNSVSYNPELDQVMITNRNFDELWVIDHNTTTEEAKGHTGGAHGMGGDLLYRWGSPNAYGMGNATNQVLWGPHDAHWIPPGLPGEGNILIFNNGMNMHTTRPEGSITTIEEIVPPIDANGGYNRTSGTPFGPDAPVWSYNATPPEDFFAWAMGGAERLPDGNTLVGGGSADVTFEVDAKGNVVWEYESVGAFKVSRYYPPAIDDLPTLNATEDELLRVNISSLLWDMDTDVADLVITEDSPFVSVSGHELLLQYPEGVVTDVVDLVVSDGLFGTQRVVQVNVTPVNDPPVLASIPAIHATEDLPLFFEVAPFISDPDTSVAEMRLTVDSDYVTVEGRTLRLLYPDGVLSDSFLLTVSDGQFRASKEVLVNVTPANDPPTVDAIPDQHGTEDLPFRVELGPYIHDVDSPPGAFSVTSRSVHARVSGLGLTLLYPEGVTHDVVHFTVSDGEDRTEASFNVFIEPVNDPPTIGEVPPINVTEDEPFSRDLTSKLNDIDTPLEGLSLEVDSAYVQVEGHSIVLLYPEGVLYDEVELTLTDGEFYASTTLVVNVEPVNDPPDWASLPGIDAVEDVEGQLDLGPYLVDIDTPLEELTVSVDSLFARVEGHTIIYLYPEGVLQDEVVVEVSDGEYSATGTLLVAVEPVNDPPWWAALPEISAVEDVAGELDLSRYLMDTDTPIQELSVEAGSPYGAVEGRVLHFNYPNGVLSEQVSLTLSDGEFEVTIWTNVTVLPVNDAPELSSARVEPIGDGIAGSLRFSVVVRDVDTGQGEPSVAVVVDGVEHSLSRDGMDTSTYLEGVAFSMELDLIPGTHKYHFTADDGDGGIARTGSQSVSVGEPSSVGGGVDPTTFVTALLVSCAAVLLAWAARHLRSDGGPGGRTSRR